MVSIIISILQMGKSRFIEAWLAQDDSIPNKPALPNKLAKNLIVNISTNKSILMKMYMPLFKRSSQHSLTKQNKSKNGCLSPKTSQSKVVAHADNVSMLVKNDVEMKCLVSLFNDFDKYSGAKSSVQKSFVIPLGAVDGDITVTSTGKVIGGSSETMPESVEFIKLLGILFSVKNLRWHRNWKMWVQS